MERKFRLNPIDDRLFNDPNVGDLIASISLIDSILGFDNFDIMSEMLEMASTIQGTAMIHGVDVNKAESIFELRELLISRFNEIVTDYNEDPDAWIRRKTEEYRKRSQELIAKRDAL